MRSKQPRISAFPTSEPNKAADLNKVLSILFVLNNNNYTSSKECSIKKYKYNEYIEKAT